MKRNGQVSLRNNLKEISNIGNNKSSKSVATPAAITLAVITPAVTTPACVNLSKWKNMMVLMLKNELRSRDLKLSGKKEKLND